MLALCVCEQADGTVWPVWPGETDRMSRHQLMFECTGSGLCIHLAVHCCCWIACRSRLWCCLYDQAVGALSAATLALCTTLCLLHLDSFMLHGPRLLRKVHVSTYL